MRLRVTQYGEPILRKVGEKVETFDSELAKLAQDMLETMYAEEGIGLAAQQIDKALQLFVMDLQIEGPEVPFEYTYDGKRLPLEMIMPLVAVNPEVSIEGPDEDYEEGCLSFPDVRGAVTRKSWVKMHFQDLKGNPHTVEGNGILGRCILHEYDHLQGKLFIDHMEPKVLRGIETKIKKLKRSTRDYLKAQKK